MSNIDESTETSPLLRHAGGNNSQLEKTNSDENLPKSDSFTFKSISRRKKAVFICMAFVNFSAAVCFSLLAPFFPKEAGIKGASPTVIGLIFGAFELVIFLSSPVFGTYLTQIGSKFMFTSGVMVCGSCAILFGLLDKCPDGTPFIVMCFLCRSVEALGASAFVTSLFAVLANEFPDNVITVLGSLETFGGLGMMVGPPIGGALYQIGGYGLPFFVLGGVTIVVGLFTAVLMPPSTDAKKRYSGSVLTLFKSPLVIFTFINLIAGSLSLGFLDPTLANHLSQFHLSTLVIGVMFLIAPGLYALTAPLWGYLGDTKGYVTQMMTCGSIGATVAMVTLAPVPLFSFVPNTLYMKVIALVIFGLFVGCGLIPSFKGLLNGALSLGMPDDLETYGKVSGFFNSSFSLGAFLGPTIGGVLVDKFGFEWSCGIIACTFLAAGLLMMCYSCVAKPQFKPVPKDEQIVKVSDRSIEQGDVQSDQTSLGTTSTANVQGRATTVSVST